VSPVRTALVSTFVVFAALGAWAQAQPPAAAAYVGSAACRNCHAPIYQRWTRTRMANVVRDPKTHPDAIIPDLSKPDPLIEQTIADVNVRSHTFRVIPPSATDRLKVPSG